MEVSSLFIIWISEGPHVLCGRPHFVFVFNRTRRRVVRFCLTITEECVPNVTTVQSYRDQGSDLLLFSLGVTFNKPRILSYTCYMILLSFLWA